MARSQGGDGDSNGAGRRRDNAAGAGQGEGEVAAPRGQRRTGLLQLGDVDQGAVLGAAQHFLQPLQTHLQLALGCRLLQRLLHLLGVEGGAVQEPDEGTHQRPAQPDALLCLAVAAGKGREMKPCSPWAKLQPQRARGTETGHPGEPNHVPRAQPGVPAASRLPQCRPQPAQPTSFSPTPGEIKACPVQAPLWPLNCRETFQGCNQIILLREAQR